MGKSTSAERSASHGLVITINKAPCTMGACGGIKAGAPPMRGLSLNAKTAADVPGAVFRAGAAVFGGRHVPAVFRGPSRRPRRRRGTPAS